jgi:hypothetical protein
MELLAIRSRPDRLKPAALRSHALRGHQGEVRYYWCHSLGVEGGKGHH